MIHLKSLGMSPAPLPRLRGQAGRKGPLHPHHTQQSLQFSHLTLIFTQPGKIHLK